MYNIKQLTNILPIVVNDLIIKLVSFEDIDWYIHNCRKPYFEKYLDFKFSTDISYDKLEVSLYNLVKSYKLKKVEYGEARLLLKDCIGNIVGGCTIFEKDKDTLELAYFIVPEYHRKGIAYIMIKKVLKALCESEIKFNKIIVTIQSDNIASINLITKLGFIITSSFIGKYTNNYVYTIYRRDINSWS